MPASPEPGLRGPMYPRGVAMAAGGGVCLSFGGLILRHIEGADGWQILFYRSIAFSLTLLAYLAIRYRGRLVRPFLAIGWRGLAVAASLGFGFTCYLYAILLTTVANVVFIISAAPFFAALLGWLVLRERVGALTWAAIAATVLGIGLMFADGFATGGLIGNIVALGVPASFALMVVLLRGAKTVDMVPATCLAGVVAGTIAALLADGFAVSAHDFWLSMLLGSAQVGVGFLLLTVGTRYVPAAEVALLSLTETVLAPIWVWLFVDELPSALTLAGGVVVLTAVAVRAVLGLRGGRAAVGA